MKTSSLSFPTDNNRQKLTHENDAYQIEQTRYNNQPGIYNINQEQSNEQQIT
jgi:hypothetical protein